MARGSAPTRHRSACSTAPAEARNVAGESGAAWCSGQMTAVAPSATAERMTAPKFCGSSISSRATTMAFGFSVKVASTASSGTSSRSGA